MSLSEAVLGVVDAMESAAKEKDEDGELTCSFVGAVLLKSFARELRTAVKAVESDQGQSYEIAVPKCRVCGTTLNCRWHSDGWICKDCRAKVKDAVYDEAELEDKPAIGGTDVVGGPRSVEVVGGNAGSDDMPTLVSIDSRMPVRAKMLIAGQVYVLEEDDRLHYSKEETAKLASYTAGGAS